ncbi:hypothetical protein Hdeb2414_s0053g00753711 [Helianthus debilis subsp. tardiflorus]
MASSDSSRVDPHSLLYVYITLTGTTPANTKHQELQFIRFVTKEWHQTKGSWVADNYKK